MRESLPRVSFGSEGDVGHWVISVIQVVANCHLDYKKHQTWLLLYFSSQAESQESQQHDFADQTQ